MSASVLRRVEVWHLPQISVIIPFHNRKDFLPQCLESVLAQTLLPAEVLIVDDGSDRRHHTFLARFVSTCANCVSVIRLDRNLGPAGARNVGLQRAKGDLIAFLDDDDIWEPAKLEIQTRYLCDHPDCAAVHTAVRAFYADGTERLFADKPSPLTLPDSLQPPSHVVPSSLMISARVLRELGGFDAAFRACEDQEFFIRFVAANHRIEFIPIPLIRFRRTGPRHVAGSAARCCRYQIAIALKHRALYTRVFGPGAVRKYIGASMSATGPACGGILGKAMQGAGWVVNHFP